MKSGSSANIGNGRQNRKSKELGNERSPLVKVPYCDIDHSNDFHIAVYESTTKVMKVNYGTPKGIIRGSRLNVPVREAGDIKGMSKKSRLRAMETFNQIRMRFMELPVFMTGTYHHDFPVGRAEIKRDLDRFLRRVRKRWPDVEYFYRKEPQERGAPHFHFLFFFPKGKGIPPHIFCRQIKGEWMRIVGCWCRHCRKHNVDWRLMDSKKMTAIYVCKYVSKIKEVEVGGVSMGRAWGRSRGLPLDAYYECDISWGDWRELKDRVKEWLEGCGKRGVEYSDKLEYKLSFFVFIAVEESMALLADTLDPPWP